MQYHFSLYLVYLILLYTITTGVRNTEYNRKGFEVHGSIYNFIIIFSIRSFQIS